MAEQVRNDDRILCFLECLSWRCTYKERRPGSSNVVAENQSPQRRTCGNEDDERLGPLRRRRLVQGIAELYVVESVDRRRRVALVVCVIIFGGRTAFFDLSFARHAAVTCVLCRRPSLWRRWTNDIMEQHKSLFEIGVY